jgi:hypothetical protein
MSMMGRWHVCARVEASILVMPGITAMRETLVCLVEQAVVRDATPQLDLQKGTKP